MNLPINGRIAIIDDQFRHAEPLIQVLSQKQLPHTYFSGELKFLPNEGGELNDVRLLFLDINLIDDSEHEDKVLRSKLIPVIDKVISTKNYPYVVVFWSRHEHHRALLEDDIFKTALKHKSPIGYLSANKFDFFNMDGTPNEEYDQRIGELFERINSLIAELPAYSYLLNWENQVHKSADNTLQGVFSSYHLYSNWSDNANYIFNKLSYSYLGGYYKSSTPEEKIRATYQAFNSVFLDSLESLSATETVDNPIELIYDHTNVNNDTKYSINKKLLISEDNLIFNYPGSIISDINPQMKGFYNDLVSKCISFNYIKHKVNVENPDMLPENKILESRKIHKEIMDSIRKDYLKIHCFVTPLCDFVQKNNHKFDRIVSGLLIENDQKDFIDDKHESIFVSPSFELNGKFYFLIIDFRCFHTTEMKQTDSLNPIFRVRQQLLAEIQSKLARHISRQGILFID